MLIAELILGAIAAVAALGALYYARESYVLQRPRPRVRAYLGSGRSEEITDRRVILWAATMDATTSPRLFIVYLRNSGDVVTGPYRFYLYAPEAITFASPSSGLPLPSIQVTGHHETLDSTSYEVATFSSNDGVQVTDGPQPICQGGAIGGSQYADILWRFTSDKYKAAGSLKVQLN